MRNQHFHPVILCLLALEWAQVTFLNTRLVAVTAQFLAALLLVRLASGNWRDVVRTIRFSIPTMLIYAGVSGLLVTGTNPSSFVLWNGPDVPLLGHLQWTVASITLAFRNVLQIWNIIVLFLALGRLTQPDDIVRFCGKRFGRMALAFTMMLQIMPNLLIERDRVAQLARMRGAFTGTSRWSARLRGTALVYRTVLQNALERSWQLAESMYVRGYGAERRTFYRIYEIRRRERSLIGYLLTANVIVLGLLIHQVWMGWGIGIGCLGLTLVGLRGCLRVRY